MSPVNVSPTLADHVNWSSSLRPVLYKVASFLIKLATPHFINIMFTSESCSCEKTLFSLLQISSSNRRGLSRHFCKMRMERNVWGLPLQGSDADLHVFWENIFCKFMQIFRFWNNIFKSLQNFFIFERFVCEMLFWYFIFNFLLNYFFNFMQTFPLGLYSFQVSPTSYLANWFCKDMSGQVGFLHRLIRLNFVCSITITSTSSLVMGVLLFFKLRASKLTITNFTRNASPIILKATLCCSFPSIFVFSNRGWEEV